MGFSQSFSSFLQRNPIEVLSVGTITVLTLFLITVNIHPLPSFKDPLLGFEVRGTPIANRLNAWRLLQDETSSFANNLTLVPNSLRYDATYNSLSYANDNDLNSTTDPEPPIVEMSIQQVGKNLSTMASMMDDGEEEYYQSINATMISTPVLLHHSLDSSKAFCGKLYEGYAQVVVSTVGNTHHGLFNLNSMLAICQIDKRLRLEYTEEDNAIFQRDCEQYQDEKSDSHKKTCCNSWSLPNFIACLNNKTSCMNLDNNDLKRTEQLLGLCSPYYHKAPYEECFLPKENETSGTGAQTPLNILKPTSHDLTRSYCGSVPEKCMRCDGWAFNVLHYLANENFVRNKQSNGTDASHSKSASQSRNDKNNRLRPQDRDSIISKLTHTNIFLPIAKSSSLMKYYQAVSKHTLKTPYAQVKVMNLGLKNSLFEHLISDDMKLFLIALTSILIVISIYTWSFILSLVILLIICLSLCLSYTIYELVLDIPVFPFMNLLAIVISFGICSDNAMLFCKHWSLKSSESSNVKTQSSSSITYPNDLLREQARLDQILKRAIVSTSVATLATACSFIISAISKVTAVRCFCIFATLSVLTNYLLIVILLPPALLLDARLHEHLNRRLIEKGPGMKLMLGHAQYLRDNLLELGELLHKRWIYNIVTKFKYYHIITFSTLLICSSIIVFHSPTLKPADDDDIQLLSRKHSFEQYDKNLRRQFAFERAKQGEVIGSSVKLFQETPETLPIRVIFGIKPHDDGKHFDPHDRGSLVFDPRFNFSDPRVQTWLHEFCQKIRQQRFVHPTSMADNSNCFIDTFRAWIETRPCQDPLSPEIDRSPCCQSAGFPYSSQVLDKCMGEAISIMRKTPKFYSNVNGGVRFFKNSTRVAALIMEFHSNRLYTESFTKMEKFYEDIDEWVTWQINNTAPPSLRSGWFISNNLDLLALQLELEQSTNLSILIEVGFAMLALMLSTRDAVLTIAGTLTISTIIIVTMAALILLKWTLGVAESILISLTIGLSIDFALHYSVAYNEGLGTRPRHSSIQRILGEVGSPIALATITTSLAGFVIVWSDILAYQELGIFLMLIASVSWLTSTFFLLPMLAVVDSIAVYSEEYTRMVIHRTLKLLIDRLYM